MGHKAHPIGLRLGIHRKWKSNWFFESKNYAKFVHLNLNIEKFFKGFLYFYGVKSLLLNCQIVKMPSNHLFIFVFFYRFRKKLKKKTNTWKLKFWKTNLEEYLFKQHRNIVSLQLPAYKFENSTFKKPLNHLTKNNSLQLPKHFIIKKKIDNINGFFNITKLVLNIQIFKKFLKLWNKNLNKYKNSLKIYKNFIYLFLSTLKTFKLNLILLQKIYTNSTIQTKTQINLHNNILLIQKNFKSLILLKNIYGKHANSLHIKLKLFENLKKNTLLHTLNKNYLEYHNYTKFNKKKDKINYEKNQISKKKVNYLFTEKNTFASINDAKCFLTKLTNSKINLIFINTLSFAKFFYTVESEHIKNKKKEKFNILQIQKIMLNKYKYNAIFIKDFVHLAFISVLLKNTSCLVQFIGEQFKRLPKNRKQLKLLNFIQQTLKIFCEQRNEVFGFKFQIQGRLNRRNRTNKWTFQKGILPIQTYNTRVEYGYSEGWTRSGLIGIKLWFFYKKFFKSILKKKTLLYLHYSKIKKFFIKKSYNLPKNFELYIKANNSKSELLDVIDIYQKQTQLKIRKNIETNKTFNEPEQLKNKKFENTAKVLEYLTHLNTNK